MVFVSDGHFKLLPLLFPVIDISFVQGLLAGLVYGEHFEFFLQVFFHVFELIIKLDLQSLAGKFIKGDIDAHGQVLGVIVFHSQEGVVGDVVVILDGEENKHSSSLN